MEDLLFLNKKFKKTKLITLATIILLTIVSLVSISFSFWQINKNEKRIYIVDKSKSFEALSANLNENKAAEINFQLERFHHLFFGLSPDPKQIDENMNKAFYLADQSAKILYEDLKETGFYNRQIQGSVVQKIEIDSIQIDTKVYPYQAKCYAVLTQTRSTNSEKKIIVTTSTLEDVPRSINSPNGLLIRNFKIMQINGNSE